MKPSLCLRALGIAALFFSMLALADCKNSAGSGPAGGETDGSGMSHVRFSLEGLAARGIAPTHIVYMDALSASRCLVRLPVTAGTQDIALPKGGYYVLGLVEEKPAARGLAARGIANSISMLGSIKVLASGLDSLPLSSSAAATIELGSLEAPAAGPSFAATIPEDSAPTAIGRPAAELETIKRYDDGLLKLLNPDIDGNGVYDDAEGLSWSFACRYSYSLRYTVRDGTVADSDIRLELMGVQLSIDIADPKASPSDPTRELILPVEFEYIDAYGLRVRKLQGVSAATLTGGDSGPETRTVFTDFPICSGDFGFAYGGKSYAFRGVNFFNAKSDLEGWVFPVLNGSRNASGSFTSLSAAWKKVAAGYAVDASAEEARMTIKSLNLVAGGYQYALDSSNGWSAGSLRSPTAPNALYLSSMGLDGAQSVYAAAIAFNGSPPRILAKDWEFRAPFGVGNSPFAVRSSGALAAVLTSGAGGGIELVDISDPSSPRALGTIAKTNPFDDAAFYASGYLCAVDSQDFFVYDVRNPSQPELVKKINTPNMMGRKVAVDGTKAYVISDYFRNVYDLADPQRPSLVASSEASMPMWGSATIKGGIALIGDSFYDIASDPAAWKKLGALPVPAGVEYYSTTWEGSTAALAFYSSGISSAVFYDVSDKAGPRQIARDDFGGVVDINYESSLAGANGSIFLSYRGATHIVRRYSASDPSQAPSLLSLPCWYGGVGIGPRADGGLLAACGGVSNSAANSPAELLAYAPAGSGYSLASRCPFELKLGMALFEAGYAFAAAGALGIAELSYDSSGMTLSGFASLDAGEAARGLFKVGEVFMAVSDKAAYSFDRSGGRLTRRSRTAGVSLPGRIDSVLVDGGVAYLSGEYTDLRVIDVSNVDAPRLLASPYYDGRGLVKYGDYLYLGNGSEGVTILSVADPSAPSLAGAIKDIGAGGTAAVVSSADAIAGSGRYLYVANSYYEIVCYDLGSSPTAPAKILHAEGDGGSALLVSGSRLYGVSYGYGNLPKLNALSLDDPAAPTLIDRIAAPEFEWKGIAAQGDSVFLSSDTGVIARYELW
jgi:hypothetical protein